MTMKPVVEQDEMFPEGASSSTWECDEVNSGVGGGGSNMDIVTSEKAIHNDFFNSFSDLFDDDDLD